MADLSLRSGFRACQGLSRTKTAPSNSEKDPGTNFCRAEPNGGDCVTIIRREKQLMRVCLSVVRGVDRSLHDACALNNPRCDPAPWRDAYAKDVIHDDSLRISSESALEAKIMLEKQDDR